MLKKSFLILLVFLTASAFSQYGNDTKMDDLYKPGIGFGPQIGYYKTQGADNGRLMYGLALRARLAPALGLEGSINYRQENYGNGALTVRSWPVMVTGLFYPLPIIYGALGIGWYNTTFDYDESDITQDDLTDRTKQLFGYHAGGGLEFPIAKNTRLTGDIRYVFLKYKARQLDETQVEDIKSNFYAVTVGVLFGF